MIATCRHWKAKQLFLAFCLLILPLSAHAKSGAEINLANRHTTYWAPPETSGKQPLLLFSHGFLGCSTQSIFLTEGLAAAGYWVFAPDHDDALCRQDMGSRLLSKLRRPERNFARPEEWDDTTYAVRADNLNNLLDALKHDPMFSARIDFTRVGLIGHSLGGYTVMGMAGAWPKWKISGIKAVVALSPYAQPFVLKHTLGTISVPIMFEGGTKDVFITPDVKKTDGSYAQVTSYKYFVEFKAVNHFSFTDITKEAHDSMIACSIDFFDHYVKGRPASPELTSSGADVATLWYNSELGKAE